MLEFLQKVFQEAIPALIAVKETLDKITEEIPLFKWMGVVGTAVAIICGIITFIKHRRINF